MKFDVIIGNPPYQLNDGGEMGISATPLYHKFVEKAKRLKLRYLTMIIPSRWFAGGKGLDEFRDEMLHDDNLRTIVGYFDAAECFPRIDISGEICYFLWDRDNNGLCNVVSVRSGITSQMERPLLEKNGDTFIRFNDAIEIYRKIEKFGEKSFESIVSSRKPFGITGDIKPEEFGNADRVKFYTYPKSGFIDTLNIPTNKEWVSKYKVYIAKAYGERGNFPYLVTAKPFIGEPNTCCSETYLVVGPFNDKIQAENVLSYMTTRLFRFLVLFKKNTQNAAKNVYSFVPLQDFSKPWTDAELYAKYGLTKDEIAFIESMVRPMDKGAKDE
jgi:site-specific DNA-methyltransferase (adenine-specific)